VLGMHTTARDDPQNGLEGSKMNQMPSTHHAGGRPSI
jgi:hypothetical protein